VLGGGVVGTQSAKMAAGLGANVTIFDISLDRLRKLDDIMPKNVNTQFSNTYNIAEAIKNAHLIIGAVLIPGAKAPNLITKEMLKDLKKGTVLVDVAVDQGGCFETTHPTTHKNPTYVIDDILHYSVANMPGAVPVTSTEALTNATISRGLAIANKGWKDACVEDLSLKLGLNIINGKTVYKAVAEAFDFDYTDINEII
jgi:alanine dehydrogenase